MRPHRSMFSLTSRFSGLRKGLRLPSLPAVDTASSEASAELLAIYTGVIVHRERWCEAALPCAVLFYDCLIVFGSAAMPERIALHVKKGS